jgi:hypothetical protein
MSSMKVYMERFKLKKLNDVEVKEQSRVKTPNRFAALENVNTDDDNDDDDVDVDISRLGKVLEYKSFSHRESRLLKLLDERKQAKLLWLQNQV